MRSLILLILVSAAAAFAQPTITYESFQYLSHNSVMMVATTDIALSAPTQSALYFDTQSTPPLANKETKRTDSFGVNAGGRLGVSVSSLVPNTTYYMQLCTTVTAVEYCSSVESVTTSAAPADRYSIMNDPTTPDPPASPTSFFETLVVDTANGCSDGLTGTQPGTGYQMGGMAALLTKAATDATADRNIAILLPDDALCLGNYQLPASTVGATGYVVIRPENPNRYPPEGVTFDTRAWPLTHVPEVRFTASQEQAFATNTNAARYRLEGFILSNNKFISGTFDETISNYDGTTWTTGTTHGYSTGHVLQIVTDNDNYLKNCLITVTSTTTFTIDACGETVGTVGIGAGTRRLALDHANGFVDIDTADSATDIILDRMVVKAVVAPYDFNTGIRIHGTRVYVLNSSFIDIGNWTGMEPDGDYPTGWSRNEVGGTIDITFGSEIWIEGNYFNSPATGNLFAQGSPAAQLSDLVVFRNKSIWDDKFNKTKATWDGYDHAGRQFFELKKGRRTKFWGNYMENQWNYGLITTNAAVVLSPRPSDGVTTSYANGITDFNAQYNYIKNTQGCFSAHGNDDNQLHVGTEQTKRVWWKHNICDTVNGYAAAIGYSASTNSNGLCWYFIKLEDLDLSNNNCWDPRGSQAYHLVSFRGRTGGFNYANNIIGINNASGHQGVDWQAINGGPVPTVPTSTDPPYSKLLEWTNNVTSGVTVADPDSRISYNYFVPGVQTSSSADYDTNGISKATCDADWTFSDTTNTCATGTTANNRLDSILFRGRTTNNFWLRHDSPLKSGRITTSDGRDVGPNMAMLDRALGKVKNARVLNDGGTYHLLYEAPDYNDDLPRGARQCTWEQSSSSTIGSGTRTLDGQASSRFRDVTFDPGDGAYLWLYCGGQQYSCPTSGSGACTALIE